MKTALLFDFTVKKDTNTIIVTREFAAGLSMVWDTWTKAELLDQWWAPRPYQTVTKSMNFKAKGMWLYYMESPQGDRHWCKKDYLEIADQAYFEDIDAFCDENGELNTTMPRTKWKVNFQKSGAKTCVTITLKYDKPEDLEKIIELGFKEGFSMALGNLDELLEAKA